MDRLLFTHSIYFYYGSLIKDCCFWTVLFLFIIGKLIGVRCARLLRDQRDRRDHSCRKATRRLTARPVESEHPETEVNYFREQQSMRKQPLIKRLMCLFQSEFGNHNRKPFSYINRKEVELMLWTIIGILLVLWLLGVVFKVAGGIIHILLVIALIVFLINFFRGRKSR